MSRPNPSNPERKSIKHRQTKVPARRPSVFIGSSSERLPVAKAIQLNLDHSCDVTIWSQGVFGLSGGTLETLVEKLDDFDFAILVLTSDDLTLSRSKRQGSPRDNVLIELGMFIGKIGRERIFAVYDRTASLKITTDLAGVTLVTYQPHRNNNLQSSVGSSCTQIESSIIDFGLRVRASTSSMC